MEVQTSPANTRRPAEAPPQFYEWSFPGSPIRILLRLPVVSQILDYLSAHGGSGSEVGGILLGTARPSCVFVTGFEPFPCEDSSFLVATCKDDEQFSRAIASCAPARVLGYVRSQVRAELSLEKEDFVLIRKHFEDPASVFLLVKLDDDQGLPHAGFFFWSHGDISERTFMPFPFDERVLQTEAQAALIPAAFTDVAEPVAPPVVTTSRGRKALWIALAGLGLAILAAALAVPLRGRLKPVEVTTVAVAPGRMALSARLSQTEMTILWDPASDPVKNARIGVLSIADDDKRKDVPLTSTALQAGQLVYRPSGQTVRLTLEVFSPTGGSVREALIAVLGELKSSPDVPFRQPLKPLASPAVSPPPPPSPQAVAATPFVLPKPEPVNSPGLPSAEPLTLEPASMQQAQPPVSSAPNIPKIEPPAAPAPTVPSPQITQPAPTPVKPVPQQVPQQVPPRPVQQARPSLPPNLRALVSREVQVQVRVTVDAAGKVTRTESLAPKGAVAEYLQNAATSAARLWKFEPAQLNGKPVSGELVLEFRFLPEKP